MPKIQFLGRVLPAALNVSIDNIPGTDWKWNGMKVAVTIKDSIVTIDCELTEFTQDLLAPITMRAHDNARAAVDLLAFATGNALIFVLETLIDDAGRKTPVVPQQPEFAKLSTSVHSPADFNTGLRLLLSEPPLFLAVRNLVDAITHYHRAPTEAAKAVESIRHMIAPNENQNNGWRKLQAHLNVGETYLKFITDTSKGPRHGDSAHIEPKVTSNVVFMSWTIMNRFIEYRKTNNTPLSIEKFPLLTM